jgi:hypothetical protein
MASSTAFISRQTLDATLRTITNALPSDSRHALETMLTHLSTFAETQAKRSQQTRKWMMIAYSKVFAVYAKHFRRAIRHHATRTGRTTPR